MKVTLTSGEVLSASGIEAMTETEMVVVGDTGQRHVVKKCEIEKVESSDSQEVDRWL